MIKDILIFAVAAVFAENFVLVKLLGLCPLLDASKKPLTILKMGISLTAVMTAASLITWCADRFLLVPMELEYLRTMAFILIIAALVWLAQKAASAIYLPLMSANCAALGVALLNIQSGFSVAYALLYGFFAAIGFTLAIVLLASVHERLEAAPVPKALEGFPITLISAGLIAMAFMGLANLHI